MFFLERFDTAKMLSKAVAAGPRGFVSGQVADGPDASAYGQTMQALDKVERYLKRAGSAKDELLFATRFIKDLGDLDEIDRAWGDWLGPGCTPTRTCVQATPASAGFALQVCAVAQRKLPVVTCC